MGIPIYQVDSFAERPFAGNPAGVCLLGQPADDAWMQNVAMEMNVSETAFPVPRPDGEYDLRWFTPAVEVDLCGHGTLAAAHILWETGTLAPERQAQFHTRSGLLTADLRDGRIELDFPASPTESVEAPAGLLEGLGLSMGAAFVGKTRFDYLVEVESEEIVRHAAPDFGRLKELGVRGVMLTARGEREGLDVVSRFLAPGAGIDEDPVTGSAHCALAPYWASKLGKDDLVAYQASKRGGTVVCRVVGDRVKLGGRAITTIAGELRA